MQAWERLRHRERTMVHDPETVSCINVQFPPFYFSTHGLSRPPTPGEEEKERYAYNQEFKSIIPG